MKKTLEVKLKLNKQTIARLDPKAPRGVRSGFTEPSTTGDKASKGGQSCSCVCWAITLA